MNQKDLLNDLTSREFVAGNKFLLDVIINPALERTVFEIHRVTYKEVSGNCSLVATVDYLRDVITGDCTYIGPQEPAGKLADQQAQIASRQAATALRQQIADAQAAQQLVTLGIAANAEAAASMVTAAKSSPLATPAIKAS